MCAFVCLCVCVCFLILGIIIILFSVEFNKLVRACSLLFRIEWFMIDRFFIFGVASLQIIPILTLTYLQHELSILEKILRKIPSKSLSIMTMLLSFGLMLSQTLSSQETLRTIYPILLIITLSLGIHYTYDVYTIDEGKEENKTRFFF